MNDHSAATTDHHEEDLVHLLAHFATLHRGGAVLVRTNPGGEWVLGVQTMAGQLAWQIRDRDLRLFDRVHRVGWDDPRVADLNGALRDRNERLAALTKIAWQGPAVSFTRHRQASE